MPADKYELFSNDHTKSIAYGDCPKCAKPLQLKYVGKSTFLGCSNYPDCDYSKSLASHDVVVLKKMDESHCPECNSELAVKKGRYGMFIGCMNFPECHYIAHKNDAPANESYEPVDCPECKKGLLIKRQNRFGKFFYSCKRYPKCKFAVNYKPVVMTCDECGSALMLEKSGQDLRYQCIQAKCNYEKKL